MKVNKHNLKMNNLKAVCSETKSLMPWGKYYLQVNWDRNTGDIWTNTLVGNSWVEYHDDNIISFNVSTPKTMQDIADLIERKFIDRTRWGI